MTAPSEIRCPACGSGRYATFAELPDMPVHVGVLWQSATDAREGARGDVALAYCSDCGMVGNHAFDPSRVDYGLRYDNALHFSETFQKFEHETAERLIDRYAMRERRIAEIGCGSGHFLSLICKLGSNRGIGFDPSFEPGREALPDSVRILREYYADDHAEHKADLVCCRHVLEHIPEPRPFLDMVRRSLDGDADAIVYFEVPNASLVLRDLSIWDVIYEHCNYFARPTLTKLFRSCGFEILDVQEPYQEQFLSIEARLSRKSGDSVEASRDDETRKQLSELEALVASFANEVHRKREEWNRRLEGYARDGQRAVIWGAGAKTVSFLNLVDAPDSVEWVTDINPGKQGTHIAGTGQCVVPPEQLNEIDPDVVVVMNPVYRGEIEAELGRMGLRPEVLAV